MKPATLLLATLAAMLALGGALQAQIPPTLNYQGRILQNGQPFSGTGYFVFGIYDGGGNLLWTNRNPAPSPLNNPVDGISDGDEMALEVRNGIFNVRLGDDQIGNNRSVETALFFDFIANPQRVRTGVHLRVWFSPDGSVGTWTRLQPDVTFASVPFAHVAAVAESVKAGAVTGNMIANGTVTRTNLALGSVDSQVLVAMVARALNPPGTILAYAGSIADNGTLVEPVPGYLFCNGANITATMEGGKFASLVAVLQQNWGGNVTSSINIPDLRGLFLRGVSGAKTDRDPDWNSRTVIPGITGGAVKNNVGSFQGDEFKSHQHIGSTSDASRFTNTVPTPPGAGGYGAGFVDAKITIQPDGGNETRPKNVYVNYIIKY